MAQQCREPSLMSHTIFNTVQVTHSQHAASPHALLLQSDYLHSLGGPAVLVSNNLLNREVVRKMMRLYRKAFR